MPSTYSTRLRLELQATGENRTTWGVKANNDFNLIEQAIAGYESIAMSDANLTLTALNAADDQSRNMMLEFTGLLTAIRTITIPSVEKLYVIRNSTTGGFALNVKTSTGTTAVVANGATRFLMCDGTDTTGAIVALPLSDGGTGGTDAASARTSLGLAIGTNVQAYDAGLQSISGLTTAADKMIYTTALDTYAVTDLTPFARTILDDANAAAVVTTIGAQPLDAGLTSISGLTTAADKMIYTTALDTYAVTDLTGFARTLLDDADATTMRTTLGLTIGTNVQAYDAELAAIAALATTDGNIIVGNGSTWVAESGATARTSLGLGSLATLSSINDSNWSGTDLAVANGGTGASDAATARANLDIFDDIEAWVCFNGTGTVAIKSSRGVSSITDLSTGYYRVNFTTSQPDTNYATFISVGTGSSTAVQGGKTYAKNVAYVEILVTNSSGNVQLDMDDISVLVLR